MGEIGRTLTDEEKQGIKPKITETPKDEGQEEVQEKEEVKDEPKKESKKEPETKDSGDEKDEKSEKVVEEKESDVDVMSLFNKEFEREFKDKDEIKALFEKAVKADELETSSKDLKQKLAEYKKQAEGLNPLSYFANEDEYVRQQFLKDNKDKLTKESIDILSTLSPEKVKNLDNVEAVKTSLMVNKELTRAEAEAYMSDRYGVEDFSDELDVAASAKIKADAHDAKGELAKLYDGIDVPEATDWEATRESLKQSWDSPLKETIKGIDKIQLSEDLEFVVDDAMKQGLENEVMSELLVNGVKPSEEALGDIVGTVKDRILSRNMDKVVKSVRADLKEQIKSELRKEVHNDKPVNTEERTDTPKVKSADQAVLGAFER